MAGLEPLQPRSFRIGSSYPARTLYVGINPSFALVRPFLGDLDVLTQATPLAMMKQGAWINCASFRMLIASRAAPW